MNAKLITAFFASGAMLCAGCASSGGSDAAQDLPREASTPTWERQAQVPAGDFLMGTEVGDHQQREVWLDAYQIDVFEVTVEAYQRCVEAGACEPSGAEEEDKYDTHYCNANFPDRAQHPINCVNWFQANDYCTWRGGELPTEAQWLKAAQGTDGRPYPWGEEEPSCRYAVMLDGQDQSCGGKSTWPVGIRPEGQSPYGVMDLSGSVSEWVRDWFEDDFQRVEGDLGQMQLVHREVAPRNPVGPDRGTMRILRGGDYTNGPLRLHANARQATNPYRRYLTAGFRCVYEP
jgi:formylglycine-generating enzyme required for sulfatase activity